MRNDGNEHGDALEQALSRLYQSAAEPSDSFETGWRAAVRREESISMKTNRNEKRHIWRAIAPACAALVLVVGSLWAGTLEPGLEGNVSKTAVQRRTSSGNGAPSAMYMAESADYDTAATAGGVADTGAGLASGNSASTPQPTALSTDRKLVRTASLTVSTTAFDADAAQVQALLESMGGYVEDLYQYGDTEYNSTRTLTLSMRLPTDQLDAFLTSLEGVGRVTNRSESTTDMTLQYADNAARLQTLRDMLTRLNELLLQAEDVSDLIEIQSAISDAQYQIDSYETTQRSIDRQVDMSAVRLTLEEETPAQSAAAGDVSLGERISAGLNASVKWLGQFFRNMLVFIVMALPVVVPVAIIAVAVWLIVRRRRARNHLNSKEE